MFLKAFDDLGTPLLLNVNNMLAPQAYLRISSIGISDPMGDVISVILVAFSLLALWAAALATASLPPWKRDVGMVSQNYALWPHMSVQKNVAFGLEERKTQKREIAERVEEALNMVGLEHLADRHPAQLSGG